FREAFSEIPGRNTGHAESGHGLHFVEAERKKLGESNGVDVGIVGAGAVPAYQKRRPFVQVVDDGGMPVKKHTGDGFGGFLGELVGIAVDVHKDVFTPVGRGFAREPGTISFAFEIAIKPFDLFVAAIGVGDWIDQDNQIFTDAADHGLIGD